MKYYLKHFTAFMAISVLVLSVCPLLCEGQVIDSAIYLKFDKQARELLEKMTLHEKIGQMIQAESSGLKEISDIQSYHMGSILSGGGDDPETGNLPEDWATLYETLQQQAVNTRLKIPLLYGIDAVHGHNNVISAVIFPHNIGLGCTRHPELVKDCARVTAKEMRSTGIHWTFAPCVTVPQDERWGRTYEGFSENPQLVSLLGQAAIEGFQGKSLNSPFSVLACAKHYTGDGGTTANTGITEKGIGWDRGDTRVDEQTLRDLHLFPYWQAVNQGVGSIMPSYSSWNGVKCSASKYLLTTILKEEIGFEGFLISDYEAIELIDPVFEKTQKLSEAEFKNSIKTSINAGMDMAMLPRHYREFFKLLKELVQEGQVPVSRIDDAVVRILRVKFAMGLMDADYDYRANPALQKEIGSNEHRAVARQAVRESLVLLKNDENVLPISKTIGRIHVAGKAADDIGYQCGGWTIEWQGQPGPVTTGGTTLLAAMKKAVSDNSQITYTKDGTGAKGADVGIVVISEKPYAEFIGDDADLTLDEADVKAFSNMKKAGIPVVVILYSGRTMMVDGVFDQADAFVAAWLPGTEGDGITDVLFGDYKPSGKLSFTWPKSLSQIPINSSDQGQVPLFEYGFGLSY